MTAMDREPSGRIYRTRRFTSLKEELSQLYYLNREIEWQQRRLSELEHRATSRPTHITGMPRHKRVTDKVGDFAVEIADLGAQIDVNIKRCFSELIRLTRYIDSLDDSLVRLILSLRYINGLSWRQVALNIGGESTEDSVRMIHNRFLT